MPDNESKERVALPPVSEASTPIELAELFQRVDCCDRCRGARNPLAHVLGGGETNRPEFCFVLINPTHRNISSRPGYTGPRFPFIGVRQFWRVLHRAGFISDDTVAAVNDRTWLPDTTRRVLADLRHHSVYLTNLVKCTMDNPDVPPKAVFQEDWPLFLREMEIIRPKRIIAFGSLTFEMLTGSKVALRTYYEDVIQRGRIPAYRMRTIDNHPQAVLPNYFPVGRGNPSASSELLDVYRQTFAT